MNGAAGPLGEAVLAVAPAGHEHIHDASACRPRPPSGAALAALAIERKRTKDTLVDQVCQWNGLSRLKTRRSRNSSFRHVAHVTTGVCWA
jgi:hypothetical protein